MAITLEANYSKKVGLPGYSSHQYLLTLRTELGDLTQVEAESKRLYGLLQSSVDRELQHAGWLPEKNGNGNGNGSHPSPSRPQAPSEHWQCSPKQKELILKIVEEHRLDKAHIEALAVERFGKGVKLLNKLEASGLIEELLEKHPSKHSRAPQRQAAPAQ